MGLFPGRVNHYTSIDEQNKREQAARLFFSSGDMYQEQAKAALKLKAKDARVYLTHVEQAEKLLANGKFNNFVDSCSLYDDNTVNHKAMLGIWFDRRAMQNQRTAVR
ncbi:hypothetical protein J4217_00965 [Candidatus Pacearchaeota archaeon]|nr:hypothetical protein [Candidatus Pacearchaeota archaeon]